MSIWLILIKIAIIFAAVELAVRILSRYRGGDHSERTNHRRGWMLVAVMTGVALGLAWFI